MNKAAFGDSHEAMKHSVEPHHSRMLEIDRQIDVLSQEKALIRASALRELVSTLKLPVEAIGNMVAGCR